MLPNEKMKKYDGCKKVDAKRYWSLIGNLLYLTATRPDIMFTISMLSRYMEETSQLHFSAEKRLLIYIQGTLDYGVMYRAGTQKAKLIGYIDSDWAWCLNDNKSTSLMFYLCAREYVHGVERSKVWWHNHLLKHNMLQLQRLYLKLYGFKGFLKMILVNIKKNEQSCIVITRLLLLYIGKNPGCQDSVLLSIKDSHLCNSCHKRKSWEIKY